MMMNAKTLSDTAIARWVLLRVAGVTSGPPGGKTEKNIQVEGKVNDDERRGTGILCLTSRTTVTSARGAE